MNIPELRPSEVLQAYWSEVLVIEEMATFLNPIYIEVES